MFKMIKIESRTLQGSRGNLISRIKNQDSRFKFPRIKIQGSRFKTQDSKIKRRLNQDKYEKVFSKTE
ncbi:hypothetical protein HKD37_12G034165 [Glycine soja]